MKITDKRNKNNFIKFRDMKTGTWFETDEIGVCMKTDQNTAVSTDGEVYKTGAFDLEMNCHYQTLNVELIIHENTQ